MARKKTDQSPAPEQTPTEEQSDTGAPSTAPELTTTDSSNANPDSGEPKKPVEEAAPADPRELPGTERSPGDRTADVEDAGTDQAVDDIAAHEADTMLAVQDALDRKHSQSSGEPGWKARLKKLLKSRRLWATIIVLILVAFALPVTRYKLLGLVIEKQVSVVVMDSKTNTPVSEAKVSLHGVTAKTNASGAATLKVPPGSATLDVSKQYYKSYRTKAFVGLGSSAKRHVDLVATGRQVPITVANMFTGRPLANARITALKTSVKTDAHGKATIVLPASAATDDATVSLKNYNSAKVTIQVTNNVVPANNFKLVPAGQIYFLSNIGGTIDVVKSNLDGSDRQTVLEGTGKEDPTTTSLLATRDWRYLALKSNRDGAPALYLIDTNNDKVSEFDGNNGTFNLIGWSGHDFMYDFVSATVPGSQTGHETVKSYDADHQQLNQLDQTQVESSSDGYIAQEFYNFYVLDNLLVYNTQWYSGGGDLGDKNASIRAVEPGGQNKKDYQTYPTAGLNYVLAAHYQPQAVYYETYSSADNSTAYYNFANQTVNKVSIDHSTFLRSYPTYLLSPSGKRSLWAGQQNGQTNLFVGDNAAQHAKPLGGLDDYQPYGWFSDDYVLLSQNGTDLYIAPASGLKAGQQPFKIGYYYKPVPQLNSYGYGYGGL